MSYFLVIVGTKDNPIFQAEFGTRKAGGDGVARFREETRHRNQFIVHATLDLVEEIQWVSPAIPVKINSNLCKLRLFEAVMNYANYIKRYMKSLDTFHQATVSTFLTAGSRGSGVYFTIFNFLDIKFMLLHEIRNEDGIRHFFQEVYDIYTKCLMNPFYEVDMPITSFAFEQKVKMIAKKYL
ncbi:hypothetical protein PMAC_003129 [Pneumocystis sp. 'macacae']|nr:hypothetical protein PMAC_003129 [Pneumocystis sp. 'macacae']